MVFPPRHATPAAQLARAYDIPALAAKRAPRRRISGGQGRMLSVAREMMTEPQLLLVDERPRALHPICRAGLRHSLDCEERKRRRDPAGRAERRTGATVADRLYLLNLGRVKAEGPGREFDNTRVRALIQECLLASHDPKKHVPDVIRMGTGFRKDHAQQVLTKEIGAFVDWRRVALSR